ncbi:hypothetical protein D9M71_727890 [compost metagenome]
MSDQIDQVTPVITLDRHLTGFDRQRALLDLEQRGAQLQTQVRQDQRQQVARQLATDMPQETPGTFAHVQTVGVGIDDHTRWRRLL